MMPIMRIKELAACVSGKMVQFRPIDCTSGLFWAAQFRNKFAFGAAERQFVGEVEQSEPSRVVNPGRSIADNITFLLGQEYLL
jgi:hypothetical protein